MWGIRWALFGTPETANPELIFKGEIMMINAWMDAAKMGPDGKMMTINYDSRRLNWIRVYFHAPAGRFVYKALRLDGSWLATDETGEALNLKLQLKHLEKMLGVATFMADISKKDESLRISLWDLPTAGYVLIKMLVIELVDLPLDDQRRLNAWNYGNHAVLAGFKTAKAVCSVLSSKRVTGVVNLREDDAADYAGMALHALVIAFMPLAMPIPPETCVMDCAAFVLLGLDVLASVTDKVKNHPLFQLGCLPLFDALYESWGYLKNVVDAKTPGIKQLCDLLPYFEEKYDSVPGIPTGGDSRLSAARKERLAAIKGILSGVMQRNLNRDSSAAERAKLLGAVLPCAYFSCTSIRPAGKKDIPCKCCSGCNVVRYCSLDCQKKDWKVHKIACRAIAAAEQA